MGNQFVPGSIVIRDRYCTKPGLGRGRFDGGRRWVEGKQKESRSGIESGSKKVPRNGVDWG